MDADVLKFEAKKLEHIAKTYVADKKDMEEKIA